jgi:integral membrane sensor domain MASE1
MYFLALSLLLLPFLIIYVYVGFCLQRLGRQLRGTTSWKAWVPMANFIYLCELAEEREWWGGCLFRPWASSC